jgi:1-aminocyclopropane-1-carboxylate deaminase
MDLSKAILQKIKLPLNSSINLYIHRLDLIDEEISGNKWFKLKLNLEQAIRSKKNHILTFGGAFSNHIAATAKACNDLGLKSTGIIRGENVQNHTLNMAVANGMDLKFVSRSLYKNKTDLMQFIAMEYDIEKYFIIPEGGANEAGVNGCKEIVSLINNSFNYIALACGTGTTLAGVVQKLSTNQVALGFSALKGGSFLNEDIKSIIPKNTKAKFEIIENYHFGGYAKHSPELISFIKQFEIEQGLKLDFVYTAKMMYGLFDLIQKKYFPHNSTIIAIHSGGLQGNQGIGIF